ncbi:MAG: hypothetical protein KKE11_07150, partial [Gammaproteobacteria bacterium]|nr:hypothetical protein [Gammaproteobacteria bacterium]
LIYPNNRKLSVNMYIGGMEWDCFNNNNTLITQAFYGRNQPRAGGAKYNGSNYFGVVVMGKHKFAKKLDLTAGAVYQTSMYDEKEFVNSSRRKDSYYQVSAGIYYRLYANFTYYVQSAYTNNHSSVFIYDYDRFEILTGISFEL